MAINPSPFTPTPFPNPKPPLVEPVSWNLIYLTTITSTKKQSRHAGGLDLERKAQRVKAAKLAHNQKVTKWIVACNAELDTNNDEKMEENLAKIANQW
jgi:3-polyprenyl-4-hydroxybenzoate decarboxylase